MTIKYVKNSNNKSCDIYPVLPMPKKSVDDDPLVNTIHMLENLTKEQAYEQAIAVSDVRGYGAFHLGGTLLFIRDNGWFIDYGYSSFYEFVSECFGIAKSTAYDYMNIYIGLVDSEVSWEQIKSIGWTKIRLFARYLNKENVAKWITIANSMNAAELREHAKQSLVQKQDKIISMGPAIESIQVDTPIESTQVDTSENHIDLIPKNIAESTPKSVMFKLFPEQIQIVNAAVEIAMDESGTTHKNVALENICIDYLSRRH